MWTVIHWCRKFQILWMWRMSGYWQQLLGIVDTSQGEGGGILKKKFWLCLYLSIAQSPTFFFRCYSLFHQDAPCRSFSIPWPASITMFLMHFITLCRKCLKKTGTVVSCLLKCQSERMSGLIRNLNALSDLRILEVGAGHATLQTMLKFSWSVVCIASGSSQCLTTTVVEVLRLRCLCNSWRRFLMHVRVLDCMLLPLSVTGVPTVSRPWNTWVQPVGSHSSSFKIKQLQQYMTLHTS